ncbi:hypothetical protein FOZ60_000592 [Perkinsus olseni]|uniref:Tetratricopeptide repeat-containing protein n=1 Tax=Perkinsus olseni TaxID=32597 RepID=A0A7J6P345_PEROL|nr:hypothetical protein FOZ60_000592 [Perkinsus olseni]
MNRSVGHRSNNDRPTPASSRASHEAEDAARSKVAALNHQATRDLREGSMASCIAHLKEAEALAVSVSDTSFHAMTLNNMASYHRAMDRPHIAMRFLVRALRLEMACQGPTADLSVAGTHLNISSVLSHLGRHHQSLRHAQGALKLLNARTTVAAMHSVGAQLEHLGRRREALTAYRRGLRFAVEHLPADAEVIEVLNVACDQLSKKRDLPLSGGNSLSISPRSSPVSDARKVEAFTDLRCPLKTVGEGTDSPTQQVVRGLGREHSTDLGSLPPFIFDAEARPSSRRVEEEELPPLVLVGELVLREEDVVEADRTIQRPVRRRQTAGEEQERREEELTQQRVTERNGFVSCPAGSLCANRADSQGAGHGTSTLKLPGGLLRKNLDPRESFPIPAILEKKELARRRRSEKGIEGGDILGSASPVGEADEVSLAGLSSRSDALDADGPPAAVLLPLDEHLDDGELFFPRDVQDGYVSWAERR